MLATLYRHQCTECAKSWSDLKHNSSNNFWSKMKVKSKVYLWYSAFKSHKINSPRLIIVYDCLQCFDAVGWVAGRASGL